MNEAIVVEGLTKVYAGGMRAVDGISFTVGRGEIFGFLGPNGAGKSTTVRILATLSAASGGSATVGGFDVSRQPDAVRRITGVALQEVGVDPLMSGRELLILQGRLFGLNAAEARRRTAELLGVVALEEVADRAAGTYSGGMRRRLDALRSLLIIGWDGPTLAVGLLASVLVSLLPLGFALASLQARARLR